MKSRLLLWPMIWQLSCTPLRMEVPQDVVQYTQEIPVQGRSGVTGTHVDEDFSIGHWQVAEVDRDPTRRASRTVSSHFEETASSGFEYRLVGGDVELVGRCENRFEDEGLHLSHGLSVSEEEAELECVCTADEAPTARLSIAADTLHGYRGELITAGGIYTVRAIYYWERSFNLSHPLGYRLDDGTPVGAVDVTGGGRVWLDATLEEPVRSAVACMQAALLLYRQPSTF